MVIQHLAMSPKSPQIPPKLPIRIELLAFPDVQLLDVAGPLQVFSSANERLTRHGHEPTYAMRIVAPGSALVLSTAGIALTAEPLSMDTGIDTLVLAGGQGVMRAADDVMLVSWVRDRAARARRVASVCTGAFILAATGLLDGRRAVTHWNYCEKLARRYPRITVDPDPIFIQDGQIFTSAGVTSGIDLALALVEQDVGREIALEVARELVVFLKRPGGQNQFSAALDLQSSDDRFASLHQWILANLRESLSLRDLARQSGMSERSFLRRYRDATGTTPSRAVERLRLEAARQLLSETRLPLKRIATQCGFGSEETMRRNFVRLHGVNPHDYRERFGGSPHLNALK
jgi:transcriptional regulator GlxA family with amidase domain